MFTFSNGPFGHGRCYELFDVNGPFGHAVAVLATVLLAVRVAMNYMM